MNLHYCITFLLLTAIVTFAEDSGNTAVPKDHLEQKQEPMHTTDGAKKTSTEQLTTTEKIVTSTLASPNHTTPAANSTVSPITTQNPNTTTVSTTTPTTPTTPVTPTTVPTPVTPTTVPSTNTTTVAPTTSLPPTTPKPTPKPDLEWIVKDKNGNVCIIANMLLKITVPYKSSSNKTVDAEFNLKNVENATATGECGIEVQTLTLTWENINSTFSFVHGKNKSSYSLTSIEVNIPVNNLTFPNNSMENISKISFETVGEAKLFTVPMNHSYTCASEKPINLNGTLFNTTSPLNSTVAGTITISKVHAEAFGIGKDTKYSTPMDCATAETPDIVPIVVGLVLAGLVVVVLIAYLVGRRRLRAQGYLSM